MSAYGHQMEREASAQSLSSGGDSEIESGIYMSSFAAAIFVAALTSVGVLVMTALIALTVMLQSCQNKSDEVVEMWKSSDDHSTCKIFTEHAELNSLGADSVPAVCRNVAIRYIREGQYMRDLNITASLAENYFNSEMPLADGLDAVLMDADDFVPSDSNYPISLQTQSGQYICSDCVEESKQLKRVLFLQLYVKLQAGGWPLVLLSRKSQKLQNITVEHLISVGCVYWSSLIMRSNEEMRMDSHEYFSRQRTTLQQQGFRIRAVISSHMDALLGLSLGSRIFKIPNPIYYSTEHYANMPQ